MANAESKKLAVDVIARVDKLEKAMAKAAQATSKGMAKVKRDTKSAQAAVENSFAGISRSAATTAKALGAAFVGSAAFKAFNTAAQQFTTLQNALKVTGLEGENLTKTFGALFQIAQKNGTAIEPLITMYARASQSAKELNLSQQDLLKFAGGVSTALAAAGTDSAAAAGGLLQLSQALASGKVRAQEFNSVNEQVPTIMQAAAAGLKEAGGSVGKLRELVNDGKVSSEAFVRAFLAGMPLIEAQAAKADGTIGQATTRIGNAFIALVGHIDKTTGASGNAVRGLNAIADVMDKLSGYFDAASQKLETLQRWLNSVGNSPVWKTLATFMGADFSPEEMARHGLSPVNEPGKPKRIMITGGTPAAPPVKPVSLADFKLPGDKDGAGANADAFKRSSDMIAKRIEMLKVEAATTGMSAAAQDRARVVVELETAARKANEQAGLKNTEVTEKQRQAIEKLADGYFKARGELERLNSPLASFARESANVGQQLENLAVSSLDRIADDFGDIVAGTKSVEDAFKSMAQSIIAELAKIAIKQAVLGPLAAMMGGGGGGGLSLPKLLGFNDGGMTGPSSFTVVGVLS